MQNIDSEIEQPNNALGIGQYKQYTGTINYIVNKQQVIQQYCEEKYLQLSKQFNHTQKILSFKCQKATFNITKSGFIEWESGTFINGQFLGDFNNGVWEDGVFYFGNFEKSIWKNGIWDGHLFRKSIWKNGFWNNGKITLSAFRALLNYSQDKSPTEKIAKLINQSFYNYSTNVFLESIWENGIWNGGLFQSGTWLNGRWQKGDFKNSQWINGIWDQGTFDSSVWVDGQWRGGTLSKNSNWLAGMFSCYDQMTEQAEGGDDDKIEMLTGINTNEFKIGN